MSSESKTSRPDVDGWDVAAEIAGWLVGQDGEAARRTVESRRRAAEVRRLQRRNATLRRLLARKACMMLPLDVVAKLRVPV